MKNSTFIFFVLAMFAGNSNRAQTVTDIDGNVYNTVTIGTQTWTQQNLRVTHYRNGDPVPNVADSAQWYSLTSGALCSYDNDPGNTPVYGLLYNWYAASDARNLAPPGWRVPTYEDWDTLQVFLGYDLVAGGKLKEVGTGHWMFPNTGAADEYDFTALPGGQRADSIYSGTFTELTTQGYWWSSSEMDTTYPWGVNISYNSEGMTNWAASTKKSGFSIRLIKELIVDVNDMNDNSQLSIYPNPAHNSITLSYTNSTMATLSIYNLLGELVLQQNRPSNNNTVDISTLTSGMYIVKLTGHNRSAQTKLLKE